MDELVHHCLQELSFEGDQGCDVSRLRSFVDGFYAQHSVNQNVDATFFTFVWNTIVQQPTVRVGTIPAAIPPEEPFAVPQASVKKKGKAKQEERVLPMLNIVEDALNTPLERLQAEYGASLRVAVDPETSFAAMTGSHIRSPKMSSFVYAALQFITRTRENGITVVELGKQSGYDQKTCFYVIKQLMEMHLVVKVKHRTGSHLVIHKHFYENSPVWSQVRDEESKVSVGVELEPTSVPLGSHASQESLQSLTFEPIDTRHLTSRALVHARVVRLLNASTNRMHVAKDMILAIGFVNPTRQDRRMFQGWLRELKQQGVIEKIQVPSSSRNNSVATCYRLISDLHQLPEDDTNDIDTIEDGASFTPLEAGDEGGLTAGSTGVKMNLTIHRQITNLIEEAGTLGMTINDLSIALCNLDKRTIEIILTRAEKSPPLPHLRDLSIAAVIETHGRERRYRYYTHSSYRALVAREHVDPATAGYPGMDFAAVGDFSQLDESLFSHGSGAALLKFHQDFIRARVVTAAKKKPPKNPILPDGSVKKGRPRKAESLLSATKRKRRDDEDAMGMEEQSGPRRKLKKVAILADEAVGVAATPAPKKRGRPRRGGSLLLSGTVKGTSQQASASTPRPQATEEKSPSAVQVVGDVSAVESLTPLSDDDTPTQPTQQVPQILSLSDPMIVDDAATEEIPAYTVDTILGSVSTLTSISSSPSQSVGVVEMNTHQQVDVPAASIPIDPVLLSEALGNTILDKTFPVSGVLKPGDSIVDATKSAIGLSSSPSRGRINVSRARRENEFFCLLERCGGITNTSSKEFYDAHIALIEEMSRAGEPTSAPVGSRLDRRTVATTLSNMELRGRINSIKTSVTTPTSATRAAHIIHVPGFEEEKIASFLADLSSAVASPTPQQQRPTVRRIEERLDYNSGSKSRSLAPVRVEQPAEDEEDLWSKKTTRVDQLFAQEDSKVRDILLTERNTVAQIYGFIVGKVAKAREFHLHSIELFETRFSSSHIVSFDNRVIHLSYYSQDLPLWRFCSLVAVLEYNEALSEYLRTEAGRQMPVASLPTHLLGLLQVGKSRVRARFLEFLVLLQSLSLVIPLMPSSSLHPLSTCTDSGQHPSAFDAYSPEGWTTDNLTSAPMYWQFNTIARVDPWASDTTLWKPVLSRADCTTYWTELETVSLNRPGKVSEIDTSTVDTTPLQADSVLAKSLRRPRSWRSDFVLTWHQCQYLERFVDASTATTPLDDDDGGDTRIRHICWVVGAPQSAVHDFFSEAKRKSLLELSRARRKAARQTVDNDVNLEGKALLARKAAEARAQRELAWEGLVNRLYPEGLQGSSAICARRIRSRYLQSSSYTNVEKWERELDEAIQDMRIAATEILKAKRPHLGIRIAPPPPVASTSHEKSVEMLIAQQGPAREVPKKRKAKEEQGDVEAKLAQRRHRFQWTREYDELARDACAIIKARCRDGPRLDLSALEQVFHAVPRNSVRQRVAHLRTSPGNDAYQKRLEDCWYDLWLRHRGTDLLPDDDPEHPSNFNIVKHIEFLRNHIDKNALRVGFAQVEEQSAIVLAESIDRVVERWDIVRESCDPPAPMFDFFWNVAIEEDREKQMLQHCFSADVEDVPAIKDPSPDGVCVVESALKMVLGTPNDIYVADDASRLLRNVGEGLVQIASTNLLNRGVLSRANRKTLNRPGRALKISESNQNALGGSIPRDTFLDAAALDEIAAAEGSDWQEWPLLATDGDMASLLQLVSENKVEFDVDISQPRASRAPLDWNSRKADDEHLETALRIRFHSSDDLAQEEYEPSASYSISQTPMVGDTSTSHGMTVTGEVASCRRHSDGLVDCAACLELAEDVLLSTLSAESRTLAKELLDIIGKRVEKGIRLQNLLATVPDVSKHDEVSRLIRQMTESPTPLLFWTGYSHAVLVSCAYLRNWSVVVAESPLTRIFPRRWRDIYGANIDYIWKAALRAVVGLIIFRPGISQAELRWRLRAVYDRQEIIEILKCLGNAQHLTRRLGFKESGISVEEHQTFWFLNDTKHWYQPM